MWSFWGSNSARRALDNRARRLFLETLEDRRVLAGTVTAAFAGQNLILTGDGLDNDVTITFTANNTVNITGNAGTTITGPALGVFVARGITAAFLGGNDDLTVTGAGFDLLGGDLYYSGGTGGNDFTLSDLSLGTAADPKSLAVVNSENPPVGAFANTTLITSLFARNISVVNEVNNSTETSIADSQITSTLAIVNRAGAGTTQNVNVDSSTIGRDLFISNVGVAASNLVASDGAVVGGRVWISNGNATGPAGNEIALGTAGPVSVGGSLNAKNGNASVGSNLLILAAVSSGPIVATNGDATLDNTLQLHDVTTVGGGATLGNGSATDENLITVFGSATSFGGNLLATNGFAGTSNVFVLSEGTVSGDAVLTNGNVSNNTAGFNIIQVGSAGPVTVGGSLSARNGVSRSNVIWIDRGSVAARKPTVLINDVSQGDNEIEIGRAASVSLGGGLTAQNGSAADESHIHVHQATIGTPGGLADNAYLTNGSVGTSSLVEIGLFNNVTLPDGSLNILDGAGHSTINLVRTTVSHPTRGKLLISAGNGNNTVNLASGAAAAAGGAIVTVANSTTVTTGTGLDTLNIGLRGGIAALDRIYASLGAGNDVLNIGAGANGAPGANAFDSTARFQFVGGGDTDTADIDNAVNLALFGPPITPAAKARFSSFEVIIIS